MMDLVMEAYQTWLDVVWLKREAQIDNWRGWPNEKRTQIVRVRNKCYARLHRRMKKARYL